MDKLQSKSIRTFIGAKNFSESRRFYSELGFEELIISEDMSFYKVNEDLGFYLQDYYVKKWVNNSMVFLEVEDLDKWHGTISKKNLDKEYKHVKISETKDLGWGRVFFMHDPSGVLWHIGEFA